MLTPFILTTRQNLGLLHLHGLPPDTLHFYVEDPHTRAFGLLLNRTNQLAFGGPQGMGMPLWVMLDCGVLSSAIAGFSTSRAHIPGALATQLDLHTDYPGPVPVSEYCACPTLAAHTVSGFSLQSQLPGLGLGARTKALALAVYGARRQVGVTQFDNISLRVHTRFGPLRITMTQPGLHTHASSSFTYEVVLPEREVLLAMARGEQVRAPSSPAGEDWRFDAQSERHHARLHALLEQGKEVWVVAPGLEHAGASAHVLLRVGAAA